MADYKELLRRAVAALPTNSGAARRAVYEKARGVLVGQLRAINPPLAARDITRHRLQLEDHIRQVEQEASEALIRGIEDATRSEQFRRERLAAWDRFLRAADAQDDPELFIQRPASFQFTRRKDKIYGVPSGAPASSELARELLAELRRKLREANKWLGQAPSHARTYFLALEEYLAGDIEDIRPGELLSKSRTLEANIVALSTDERLSDAVAAWADFSGTFDDFKALFPDVVKIDAARLAQRIVEGRLEDAYDQSLLAVEIAARSKAVDESAIEALRNGFRELEAVESVITTASSETSVARAREARAALISQQLLAVRNFTAAAVQGAQEELVRFAKEVGPRIRKGSLDGIEEGTRGMVKGTFVALAFSLGGVVAALAVGVASFVPLARRSEDITTLAAPDQDA